MKKLLSILAVLAMFLVGCATSTVTVRDNTFIAEGSPSMRVRVDSALVEQPMFVSSGLVTGGDFAGDLTTTVYPFVALQQPIERAVLITFADLDRVSTGRWTNAGGGADKDVDGYTMRVWAGGFRNSLMEKEAIKRGWKLSDSYSCVYFKRIVNPQRMMNIIYIERGTTVDMEALEARARKAFKIER